MKLFTITQHGTITELGDSKDINIVMGTFDSKEKAEEIIESLPKLIGSDIWEDYDTDEITGQQYSIGYVAQSQVPAYYSIQESTLNYLINNNS